MAVMRKLRREPVTFFQVIDAKQAQQMLDTMAYDHQRTYRPKHAQDLANAMRNGKFGKYSQIRIAIYKGEHFLIDGQHRLNAIVQTELPQLFTIVETEVYSSEELADQYSEIDHNLRRNDFDDAIAHGLMGEFELHQEYMLKGMIATIKYMATGCLLVGKPLQNNIETLRLYGEHIKQYEDLLNSVNRNSILKASMRRASTMAVALLTLRFSAPQAKKDIRRSVKNFWIGLLNDDGLRFNDPRKVAYRHLTETVMPRTNTARGVSTTAPYYSTRYIGACFTAYIEEREIQRARVPDAKGPLNIWGVPNDPAEWLK